MLQLRGRLLGWIAVIWGMVLAMPLLAQTELLPPEKRADAERALQKALKTVEFITDPKEYAEAQIKIGLVWAQLGETDKANTAFQRVSQTLIQISEPSQRLEIEKNMFRAYARAGMWNRVMLAKTLPDPNERDELMTDLLSQYRAGTSSRRPDDGQSRAHHPNAYCDCREARCSFRELLL